MVGWLWLLVKFTPSCSLHLLQRNGNRKTRVRKWNGQHKGTLIVKERKGKKYPSKALVAELSLYLLLENPFGQSEPAAPAVSSSNLLPILQPSHWGSNRLGKGKCFDAVQLLFSSSYQHCLSHRSKTAQQGLLWRKSTAGGLPWGSFCCVHCSSLYTSNHIEPTSREKRCTQDFLLKSLIKFQAL